MSGKRGIMTGSKDCYMDKGAYKNTGYQEQEKRSVKGKGILTQIFIDDELYFSFISDPEHDASKGKYKKALKKFEQHAKQLGHKFEAKIKEIHESEIHKYIIERQANGATLFEKEHK